MADLQSMTLAERMNTINGDNVNDYTFKEALNKWLVDNSPHNSVTYTEYNKYTEQEAMNLIYNTGDLDSQTVREILNKMAGAAVNDKYTSQEALNQIETAVAFSNAL